MITEIAIGVLIAIVAFVYWRELLELSVGLILIVAGTALAGGLAWAFWNDPELIINLSLFAALMIGAFAVVELLATALRWIGDRVRTLLLPLIIRDGRG